MEGFTIVDGIVTAIIVISAILAYSRGFVREGMSIAGWLVAAVVAFYYAPAAAPLAREIPVVSDYLTDSCELTLIVAFVLVFAITLVVVSILTAVIAGFIQSSALGHMDSILGFIFGAARGLLLVAIAFVVYDRIALNEGIAIVDNSRTAVIFGNSRDQLNDSLPNDAPSWIINRYEEFMAQCTV